MHITFSIVRQQNMGKAFKVFIEDLNFELLRGGFEENMV